MSADDSSWDELSLATYAAASLPQISASELRHCLRHRPEIPLASCVHLSNPATGSTSLADAFRGEAVFQNVTSVDGHKSTRRNVVFPLYLGKTGRDMMHSHACALPGLDPRTSGLRIAPALQFCSPRGPGVVCAECASVHTGNPAHAASEADATCTMLHHDIA